MIGNGPCCEDGPEILDISEFGELVTCLGALLPGSSPFLLFCRCDRSAARRWARVSAVWKSVDIVHFTDQNQ